MAIHAPALGDGRECAATVGLEVQLGQFVAIAVVEEDFSLGTLAVEFLEVLRSQLSGLGHVGGGNGRPRRSHSSS